MLLHHQIDPLVVGRLASLRQGSAAQDRVHPAVAVRGQVRDDGTALCKHEFWPLMAATAATAASRSKREACC